jgi:uncharacterized membrane protein YraQ (UPF0718 family)
LGVTLAFLISSPLVDAVSVAIFLGIFGFKITMVYVVSGILLSMTAGFILGQLKLDHLLTDWVKKILENKQLAANAYTDEGTTFLKRLPAIFREAFGIVKGVFLYVLAGIAIGALMHGCPLFKFWYKKEFPSARPLLFLWQWLVFLFQKDSC